jgi:3-oxoacyl-[acyl-carrier-protein] synthase II
MKLKRVVVTGMGAISPIGNNVADFWTALLAGTSGVGPITRFDTSHFKTRFACEVKNFDPLNLVDKKEARKMDLFSHYALAAAEECILDSGIKNTDFQAHKAGVIWGSGNGGFDTFEQEVLYFGQTKPVPRFNPFFIPKLIPNMAAGLISMRHGLKGINFTTVSACASSNNAIADAYHYIKMGRAHLIVAGGSEAPITQAGVGGFNALKALSENNEGSITASRPLDKDRDGFVLGEGSGALLLEELDHALARGAKIYAEVRGCGFASDAYHMTASHPEGHGAIAAMYDALDEAELKTEDIDYINLHATSTSIGDLSEIRAINSVFGHCLDKLNLSATKSMTGHLLGGAGAIEAVASIMTIQTETVPPTMHLDNPDPEVNPSINLTPNKPQKKAVRYAMSNNFGFGGHNAILIFGKYEKGIN